jgi:hypothetical protein
VTGILTAGAVARCEERVEATVEVHCPAEAVIGLPLPVRLVIRGEASIVPPHLTASTNPFPFTMTSDEATCTFPARRFREVGSWQPRYHEPRQDSYRIPLRKTRVTRGKSCEFVMDLSLLDFTLGPHGPGRRMSRPFARGGEWRTPLAPGTYVVEFREPGLDFELHPDAIRLVEPNAEERKLLERLASSFRMKAGRRPGGRRPNGEAWRTFVEQNGAVMSGLDTAKFSDAGREQLRYYSLLASFVASELPMGELAVGQEDLDGLLPGYRNEVLALRYEIELARGDQAGAEETRRAILWDRPDAAAVLDHVRDRGGMIARSRKAAAVVSPSNGGT